jgi:epoxyqueuosine reductase
MRLFLLPNYTEELPSIGQIRLWAEDLGFSSVGISDIDLTHEHDRFKQWLRKGYAGDMNYLHRNIRKRMHPDELVPETLRIISVTMNYLSPKTNPEQALQDKNKAYIARYALGRDYHKLMRKRLVKLADKISVSIPYQKYRVFADSAPVLEKPIGAKAKLGWIGKHTLLLNKDAGSWFFLGEIFTNAPLPTEDKEIANECGKCSACMTVCPTNAIIGPQKLQANKCISYLTIEHKGIIPEDLREPIGNRIFGCDDCQIFCPWNRTPTHSTEPDFEPRNNLDNANLLKLFKMSASDFEQITIGSPLRRINYEQWQRNLAIAIGNSGGSPLAIQILLEKLTSCSEMVAEHINWAINQLEKRSISEKSVPDKPSAHL